jgi:hypothetical protein
MRATVLFSVLATAFSLASSSQGFAADGLKASFKNMTQSKSRSQQEVQRKIKSAIEAACRDLGRSETEKLVSESIEKMEPMPGGGRVVTIYPASCTDLDLPCSAPVQRIVNEDIMISSGIVMKVSGSGESYLVKLHTLWSYDEPMPMVDVNIEASSDCRGGVPN